MIETCCQCEKAQIEVEADYETVDGVVRASYEIITDGAQRCEKDCYVNTGLWLNDPCFVCADCAPSAAPPAVTPRPLGREI